MFNKLQNSNPLIPIMKNVPNYLSHDLVKFGHDIKRFHITTQWFSLGFDQLDKPHFPKPYL